ncbi:hypothetical protein HAX54_010636 [Datura stramonium]|uniref:Uncharacterized protein n=1 Tax=Datura stramonium TaxID=4076 RepID=A0ABS8RX42_DATST|nr:hypothetical protein [Datura stramonium]
MDIATRSDKMLSSRVDQFIDEKVAENEEEIHVGSPNIEETMGEDDETDKDVLDEEDPDIPLEEDWDWVLQLLLLSELGLDFWPPGTSLFIAPLRAPEWYRVTPVVA